ncbi:hypothetical protein DID88_002977 [Monilinia fructigena]|uniref:Dienelactone hydrolase domain-containing protein n=1 Tax=Monilinia fructigena TaxID=38457 RepID=A0A395IET2_9HELO|nr:hypothetical protein DID88_002977 [Monilinia fructigena]
MASNPPARCCSIGVKHEGQPTGSFIKIADNINTYVAEPKENVHKDTAIIYLSDVIGIWQNSQLMADQFAANGYYTILPDIFNGYTKIGAVGYCFGGKYVARYLAEGKGIDVGYVAHPSFIEEDELRAIKGPFSIAAAETDHIFPTDKRHKSEEILKEIKAAYQINLYSGTEHGFSVRCDLSKPEERFSKEQAFLQAIAWFDHYLD